VQIRTPADAEARLRQLVGGGELDVPLPGAGRTDERFERLLGLAAAEDLSVGRLAEAHCDAVAIAAEAGRVLPAGAIGAVWASRYRGSAMVAERDGAGWRLHGAMRFCSGASVADVAMLDAQTVDGTMQLFEVPLRSGGLEVDTTVWASPALAATGTGRVELDVVLKANAAIGPPGFYLDRAGFWFGAIGVAACWAGGAHGVLDGAARHANHESAHVLASLGRATAACWGMRAALFRAGIDIDRQPRSVDSTYALTVRHLVASACREVLDAGRHITGAGPLAFDDEHAQRRADLDLYVEQQHHEADLEEIARRGLAPDPPS